MAANTRLKNELTEDETYHNLMMARMALFGWIAGSFVPDALLVSTRNEVTLPRLCILCSYILQQHDVNYDTGR